MGKEISEANKKRILYIDALNVLAILAVLLLHHNGIVFTFSNHFSWYTSLVVECVFYYAVPVFVMISGAMLMGYREKYGTKSFFKKRVAKVLIPAIFWIVFVIIWRVFIVKTMVIDDWSFTNVMNIVFLNKAEFIYYYLFLIMGVYLTMPVLSRLAKPEYKKTLWYIVGVFFIFNALLPNLLELVGVSYNTNLGLMMGTYAMYAVLGYLLSTTDVPKKYRIILYCLAILLVICRYAATAVLSVEAGSLVKFAWGYGQFHAIILASAVFVFVKNMKFSWLKKHERIINLLGKLAVCSFGVYLIHKIVMYYEVKWFGVDEASIWWRTIGALLTYGVSVLIVLIMKKIPVLKRLVP